MKLAWTVAALIATVSLTACDEAKTDDAAAKPATSSASKDAKAKPDAEKPAASAETKPAKAPEKLDSDGLEKLADGVKFTQGDLAEATFKGKLENSGANDIGRLEYKAFAYDAEGTLLEMIAGKFPKKLAAGASADLEVGPFTKIAGKDNVAVEVVVSWMNVDGTSWQRPVPRDRAKGGPNNALKK